MRCVGLLVVIGVTQGAVVDIVNLVHKYEDEILGRSIGFPGIGGLRQRGGRNRRTSDVGK